MHWANEVPVVRARDLSALRGWGVRTLGLVIGVALMAFAPSASAAPFTVNTIGDAPDAAPNGACLTAGGVCTLRAAMDEAGALAGADTITFSLPDPSTITLATALPDIAGDLAINGPGPQSLTVERGESGAFRVFTVQSGTVAISGMTITRGFATGATAMGGGILNGGDLTVDEVELFLNQAEANGGSVLALGGAIANSGTLHVSRSTLFRNTAGSQGSTLSEAQGGGIANLPGGELHVVDSLIEGNFAQAASAVGAPANAKGAGMFLDSGDAFLTNVTITENVAVAHTAGASDGRGGGLAEDDGGVRLTASTLTGNTAATGANLAGSEAFRLRNTILAHPILGANCAESDQTSSGFNLASDASCGLTGTGDQESVNPLLEDLADNGGPTWTHALPPNSPAVDQGSSAAVGDHPALTTDQRGEPRPADLPGVTNAAGGDGSDIGAFELQPAVADYAETVLADSPAGHWRFGEPSGTLLTDSSPNGNDGTYIGGVGLGFPDALVNDANTAARYDGSNDQGRVPDDNTLDVGNSFTAEGWIKRSSTTKTHELMNKGASGIQLVVMNAGSANQVWLRRAGVATIARSSAAILADGAYHHVVATMNGNGSTARIYVDGVDSTVTVSPAQTILNTAFPLTFGSFGSAPATPADYDEFALYDGALTATDVTEHYTAATTPAS